MQPQIRLEISTGNGNTALAANCGSLNPAYQPLLDIALGGLSITDTHGATADKIGNGYLDSAVDSLRNNRAAYQGLTATQIDLRPQVLDFVRLWRDACRAHPLATIYIMP
jgi:hypothetical protein